MFVTFSAKKSDEINYWINFCLLIINNQYDDWVEICFTNVIVLSTLYVILNPQLILQKILKSNATNIRQQGVETLAYEWRIAAPEIHPALHRESWQHSNKSKMDCFFRELREAGSRLFCSLILCIIIPVSNTSLLVQMCSNMLKFCSFNTNVWILSLKWVMCVSFLYIPVLNLTF